MTDVVLFDGVCNLCAGSVQFILKHEADSGLRFAPLQSAAGARLLREWGFDPGDMQSFVLLENGVPYMKSDAALRIARRLRMPWRLARLGLILPRVLRDRCYDVIARNRYRWFGRRNTCMLPSPAITARFLAK